jgi:predicted RNA-binding Zn-ribbon protein involved in translation (DUF1610 family)
MKCRQLQEAAKRVCKPEELLGAIGLIDHLAKACFIQGLHNERIQTIVRSRGESISLLQAVEVSIEEEGAISMRGKSTVGVNAVRCTNCNRLGHLANKCLNSGFPLPNARAVSVVRCFKCRRAGHLARYCRQESNKIFADRWVTLLLVVRERRWIPGGKGAFQKLHAVSRGAGYVRETEVRDRPAASHVLGQEDNRLQYLLCKGGRRSHVQC